MRNLLLVFSCIIAATCGMRQWQFIFPPRLFIYDIFMLFFIILYLFHFISSSSHPNLLNSDLKFFILLIWIGFAIQSLSVITSINDYYNQESLTQFYRGLLTSLTFTIFATLFCMFASEVNKYQRNTILNYYILGVVLSSIYTLISSLIYKFFGIRLEALIWNYISYNPADRYIDPIRWSVLGFRRGEGFPGVNASATYTLTVIPILIIYLVEKKRLWLYLLLTICLFALLATFSRTGIISSLIAFTFVIIFGFRHKSRYIVVLIVVSIPLFIIGIFMFDYISQIIFYRQLTDSIRLSLWDTGLSLFIDNPFLGIGLNNFSAARWLVDGTYFHDANLHNSWLTILVETGMLGLSVFFYKIIYIIYKTVNNESIFSKIFLSTLLGLLFGGIFNQLFDLFYFKFFIVLSFCLISLDHSGLPNDSKVDHLMPLKK